MKIKLIKHENVNPDGTFTPPSGAVHVNGAILMSQENGGCNFENCTCSEGHWITIVAPRTEDGIVFGIQVKFNDQQEMQKFFNERELSL